MDSYQTSQGGGLAIDVTLRDAEGAAVVLTGSETLVTTVWPGGNRAASFFPATTVTSAADGTIRITILGTNTADLAAGRYQLLTTSDGDDAYPATLDITPTAGIGTAPKVYADYADLLDHGGPWLSQLTTGDDETGFAEKLGAARSWLDGLAQSHYRSGGWSGGGGPSIASGTSSTLQAWLDADALIVTAAVREATACHALAAICRKQIGTGEGAAEYARLARMYRSQADYLATTLTLEFDTNADGITDLRIDLSCCNPAYG